MKIRNGFVSNSSSSSFIICKHFMEPDTINDFRDLMGKLNTLGCGAYDDDPTDMYEGLEIVYDENTCLNESENYFFGDAGYEHCDVILRFMELHKIPYETFILEDV